MKQLNRKRKRSDTIKGTDTVEDATTEQILKNQILEEKTVLLIYTGGTIGCFKTENGLAPAKGFLFEYLKNHPSTCDQAATKLVNPELNNKERLVTPITEIGKRVSYKIFEFDKCVDSSNILAEDWINIGQIVANNYDLYDSFVILHGTDTMHNTASMLSFLLENLSKTVIITGSQIPMIEQSNDGVSNVINSLIIAGVYTIPEVTICFNNALYRGNRVVKYDSVNFKAFDSPNLAPLAVISSEIRVRWDLILPPPANKFNFSKVRQ